MLKKRRRTLLKIWSSSVLYSQVGYLFFKLGMGEKISIWDHSRMTHMEFLKKLRFLKPQEPTPGVLGCFFFSLCLILCLSFLDYGFVIGLPIAWFKSNGSSPESRKVGFLEVGGGDCDIYKGDWVWDESYPLYQSRDCMFLDGGFRCTENGRPDNFYTKWRWQPKDCNLPRFVSWICLCLFVLIWS